LRAQVLADRAHRDMHVEMYLDIVLGAVDRLSHG
jgi:hypothetical protein